MSQSDQLNATQQSYDAVAASYAGLLPGLDAETALDVAMIDDFAERSRTAALGPVADVGCGSGRISKYLSTQGLAVFGVDLSAGMVHEARQAHPDLRFEVGSMNALDVPDAHLGGVLAWYSIIHTPVEELSSVFAEFRRILAPGAHLLLAFQAGRGQRVDREHAYGHSVALTNYRLDPRHVADLLNDTGLVVRTRLIRAAEGHETTPQAVLLAQSVLA